MMSSTETSSSCSGVNSSSSSRERLRSPSGPGCGVPLPSVSDVTGAGSSRSTEIWGPSRSESLSESDPSAVLRPEGIPGCGPVVVGSPIPAVSDPKCRASGFRVSFPFLVTTLIQTLSLSSLSSSLRIFSISCTARREPCQDTSAKDWEAG